MAVTSRKSATAKSVKKTTKKAGAPKYSPAVGAKVGDVLDALKHGTLRSGGSGEKVTDRKQAIAIGLSEARRSGADVPPNPNRRKTSS